MAFGKADIESMLRELHEAIDKKLVRVADRNKNKNTMARLGFLYSDVIDELRSITAHDYIKGPDYDYNDIQKGPCIWVFKRYIDGHMIYIKFYVHSLPIYVISFHFDETF